VTVLLKPELICEVQYASRVSKGNLREPVFVRLRPDKTPEDCVVDCLSGCHVYQM
jgi:bifunctional non-homologous end joining protein LigD